LLFRVEASPRALVDVCGCGQVPRVLDDASVAGEDVGAGGCGGVVGVGVVDLGVVDGGGEASAGTLERAGEALLSTVKRLVSPKGHGYLDRAPGPSWGRSPWSAVDAPTVSTCAMPHFRSPALAAAHRLKLKEH